MTYPHLILAFGGEPALLAVPRLGVAHEITERLATDALTNAHDLRLADLLLLDIVSGAGDAGMRATNVAEAMQVVPSRVTYYVTALEERGLVRRAEDPEDGRAVRVHVTPAGAEIHKAALATYRDFCATLVDGSVTGIDGQRVLAAAALLDGATAAPTGETGVAIANAVRQLMPAASIQDYWARIAGAVFDATGLSSMSVMVPLRLMLRVIAVEERGVRMITEGSSIPRTGLEPTTTAYRSGEPLWINSAAELAKGYKAVARHLAKQPNPPGSMLCVPVLAGDKVIAVIGSTGVDEGLLSEPTRALFLTLAELVAVRMDLDARGICGTPLPRPVDVERAVASFGDSSHVAVMMSLLGGADERRAAVELGIPLKDVKRMVAEWIDILDVSTLEQAKRAARDLGIGASPTMGR